MDDAVIVEALCSVVVLMFTVIMFQISSFKKTICKKIENVWKRANHHKHDSDGNVVIIN